MAQGALFDWPGLFARIHRILMTTAAAGVKRDPTFRHIALRHRLMTVMAIFGLIFASCRMMTGGAIHALEGGMHLMHESDDSHFVPVKIENFLAWRNLFGTHHGRAIQQDKNCK